MSFFALRPATPGDRAFVADSWRNSIRAATDESLAIDWESFRAHHDARIDAILDSKDTRVTIAHPPGDDVTIYGFIADGGDSVVHMIFVKAAWRRQGIASALWGTRDHRNVTVTAWTSHMSKWIWPRFGPLEMGRQAKTCVCKKCSHKHHVYESGSARPGLRYVPLLEIK